MSNFNHFSNGHLGFDEKRIRIKDVAHSLRRGTRLAGICLRLRLGLGMRLPLAIRFTFGIRVFFVTANISRVGL